MDYTPATDVLRPRLPLPVAGVCRRAFCPNDALARHANDRDIWRSLRDRFPSPYTLTDAEWYMRFVPC